MILTTVIKNRLRNRSFPTTLLLVFLNLVFGRFLSFFLDNSLTDSLILTKIVM